MPTYQKVFLMIYLISFDQDLFYIFAFLKQMRSHDAAMARLCELVNRHTFEDKYGLLLPEYDVNEPEYKKILTAHACKYIEINKYH